MIENSIFGTHFSSYLEKNPPKRERKPIDGDTPVQTDHSQCQPAFPPQQCTGRGTGF
ncbi:MAG: hypothetical protein ACYYK0_01065 [Candidatus Eutrophobiaceae bacterium]